VSVSQLARLGISDDAVNSRVRTGRLHRVHVGVYSVGHALLMLRGRWMAAVLACGEGAVLSHVDAAALWGLIEPRGTKIHVTVSTRNGRRRPGLTIHRSQLHPDDRDCVDEIPVTSVSRTLLDLTTTFSPAQLRRAYEGAERRGELDIRSIERLLRRSNGRRGIAALRTLIDYDPAPALDAMSELELLFLDLVRDAGLPSPAGNVLVENYLVDAYWPAARLVVELDSYEFHSGRRVFERDHRKIADLRLAEYEVLPLTYRQVTEDPTWVASTVRRHLNRAAAKVNV